MRTSIASIFGLYFLVSLFCQEGYAGQYTRIGAETNGNATGEIGPFEGAKGLTCPDGYRKGEYLPNPYKDEKPLFRIDHTNVDKYAARLSPGQTARLKKNKNYYMTVYPTHRNMEYPEEFCLATERSAESSSLDDKNILQGFQGGIAFPFPKNGFEAIWNVKRPYMGDDSWIHECRRIVSPSGTIKKSMRQSLVIQYDERRLKSKIQNPDKLSYKIKAVYTYPADEAGTTFLTLGYIDDNRLEDAWMYVPTLRRVRRAPSLIGGGQLDGESTMDELSLDFRGPINDWNWKLLGKKEMYIPVNCYDMWGIGKADDQECQPGDINPDGVRYELRRVWVVEGTVKEGVPHPYIKRVGYYDEDTWLPSAGERYDKRGNLWRMAEYYMFYDYCQKVRNVPAIIYINLDSGRYEVSGGCRTKDTLLGVYDTGLKEEEFTIQELRNTGR